jgi:hypothetical protein
MIERIAEASSRLAAGVGERRGTKDTKVMLSTLWTFGVLNLFFASVEIVSTSVIVWHAWKWPNPEVG